VTEQPVFHAIRTPQRHRHGLLTARRRERREPDDLRRRGAAAWRSSCGCCSAVLSACSSSSRCLFLFLSTWVLPFKWIERVFGLMGLLMGMFVLSAVAMRPDWSGVAQGAIPHIPSFETPQKGCSTSIS
jgi:hypothetical protein